MAERMTEPNYYPDLESLWHAWFGAGWPEAEDIPSLERDIRALVDRAKPKHEARKPHPATMAGRP